MWIPRRKVGPQLLISPPVRKPGRVAQHVPCGDTGDPRILLVVLPEVIPQWPIQLDYAAIDESQDGEREHLLREAASNTVSRVSSRPGQMSALRIRGTR